MKTDLRIEEILRLSPVIPVVTIEDASIAVDVARALLRGGIRVMEVTLRTAAALEALRAIVRSVPEICAGAGTVLNPSDLNVAAAAGAAFAISPGSTPELLEAAARSRIPYLPAVATPSEVMTGFAAGYRCFKFFPAATAGGPAALEAFSGPLPEARFCPTGGINATNAACWLALPNVLCVGGSWLVPRAAQLTRDWEQVETLARAAAALRND